MFFVRWATAVATINGDAMIEKALKKWSSANHAQSNPKVSP
jgi:hypothetical protein